MLTPPYMKIFYCYIIFEYDSASLKVLQLFIFTQKKKETIKMFCCLVVSLFDSYLYFCSKISSKSYEFFFSIFQQKQVFLSM